MRPAHGSHVDRSAGGSIPVAIVAANLAMHDVVFYVVIHPIIIHYRTKRIQPSSPDVSPMCPNRSVTHVTRSLGFAPAGARESLPAPWKDVIATVDRSIAVGRGPAMRPMAIPTQGHHLLCAATSLVEGAMVLRRTYLDWQLVTRSCFVRARGRMCRRVRERSFGVTRRPWRSRRSAASLP